MGKGPDKEKPSEAEVAGKKIAVKQWADAKKRMLPLERKVRDITQDKGLRRSNELASVASEASEAYGEARKDMPRRATARGINPNSGAVSEELLDMEVAQGEGMGRGGVDVVQGRENRRRAAGMNTVATGREIEGQTMTAYDSLGGIQSAKDRAISQVKEYERQSYGRVAGQAIGMAAGYGMGGGGGGGTPQNTVPLSQHTASGAGTDFLLLPQT